MFKIISFLSLIHIFAAGDEIRVVSPWRAAVITVSDKGARGQRRDESGPLACQMLEEAGFAVVEQLKMCIRDRV